MKVAVRHGYPSAQNCTSPSAMVGHVNVGPSPPLELDSLELDSLEAPKSGTSPPLDPESELADVMSVQAPMAETGSWT
jgi:hypothetical protein